jgi:hypothetical protein
MRFERTIRRPSASATLLVSLLATMAPIAPIAPAGAAPLRGPRISVPFPTAGVAVAAGPAGAEKAPPSDSVRERGYRYEDRWIVLREVPGVYAVGLEGAGDEPEPLELELTAGRATLFLGRASVDAWRAEAQVEIADVEGAARWRAPTAEEDEAILAGLLSSPRVTWAYPALRNTETDNLLLPTPRLILQLAPGVPPAALAALPGVRTVRALRGAERQYLVEVADPLEHPCDAAARLAGVAALGWIEPDFAQYWRQDFVPNDPQFVNQWHLRNTGQGGGTPNADARLVGAWDWERGNGSAVVGVVDDGVQTTHPDFAGRIFVNAGDPIDGSDNDGNGYVDDRNGWDFFFDDNNPNPILTGPGSHGTAVAGVAAAAGNNGVGVAGACLNCRILPVRIFNGGSVTTNANIAEAILYAGDFAWVVNNSWGGGSPAAAITNAINTVATTGANGLGTPVVFSTGNSASGYVTFSLTDIPGGTYRYQWVYQRDGSLVAGFNKTWLDNVLFPGGAQQLFEGCAGLPSGWTSTGAAPWSMVVSETRSSSALGGRCALGSGAIGHNQSSGVQVTRTHSGVQDLVFQVWTSSERNSADGTGPLILDNGVAPPECYDNSRLNVYDNASNLLFTGFVLCGTFSNQGNPLQDGVVSYPASLANAVAVGAAANFDRRSDYSQWGPEIDVVAHSNGGSLGITTTDIVGANGYSTTNYTDDFGGTSSAAPLASGILALLLTDQPTITLAEVRERLNRATRKIGTVAYTGGRNNQYGYGAVNARTLLQEIFRDGFQTGNLTRWSNF